MGEQVTATAWTENESWWERADDALGLTLARVLPGHWYVWNANDDEDATPASEGERDGQAGRDAADAALRAAGVVLL